MYCENCGTKLPDGSLFCVGCGKKINNDVTDTSEAVTVTPITEETATEPVITPTETAEPVSDPTAVLSAEPETEILTEAEPISEVSEPQYISDPQPIYSSTPANSPLTYQFSPVINTVKRIGTSPVFLIAIIAYSLAVILSLASSFSMVSNLSGITDIITGEAMTELEDDLYSDFYYDEDYDSFDEITPAVSAVSGVASTVTGIIQGFMIVILIISMIPSALIITGLWMTFAAALSKKTGGMKTTGLTILKVMAIIGLVGICVLAGIYGILLIVLLIASIATAGETVAPLILSLVFLLIIGGLCTYLIIYQVKVISTINTVKNTIITGTPSDKVSMFVAVNQFIAAGFYVLYTLIFGVFMALFKTALNVALPAAYASIFNFSFISLIPMVAVAVSLVCFGITIITYRNKMREYMALSQM